MKQQGVTRMVALCGCAGFALSAAVVKTPPIQGGPGGPLPGLSSEELGAFNDGRLTFQRAFQPPDGLGPVFNGVSCGQCHAAGALGGAATNLGVARVTRIGAIVNGAYSDLANVGGPVLQARSLREFIQGYPVPGEVVPPSAQFVSRRLTTPVFGDGLIEAIPAETILAGAARSLPDGIHGVVNMVLNPATGQLEVGRFGWKAQHSTIDGFTSDAFLNEMGITSPAHPTENRPQGNNIPPGADPVPDPEEMNGDVARSVAFMRFLAPIPRAPGTRVSTRSRGEVLFTTMGCVNCHTPSMQTAPSQILALSNRTASLYSDLLLHQMGPGLADGIQQGQAKGDQFRTAPLWGMSIRNLYLHDGRANTIGAAIGAHGGEGAASAARYAALSVADKAAVDAFVKSL